MSQSRAGRHDAAAPAPTAGPSPRWPVGAAVTLRSIWRGWMWFAFPAIVVEDSERAIALWTPAGARFEGAVAANGKLDRLPGPHRAWAERTVLDAGALRLARPGAAYDVWARWSPDHRHFLGWKVNFQEPLRRSRLGFDTMDHLLDLVIEPDLAAWHLKDDHELDEAVARELVSAALAADVRAECERVIATVRARGWPFSAGIEAWAPPPDWSVPTLPADWRTP